MDRKGLAVKSSVIGLGSKLLSAFLAFLCRKFFLLYLGTDLLGISSTLSQVLDTLSLTELGFQTAIVFQLYKPLVNNDRGEVSKIIVLLKKVYMMIGTIIMILGILLIPFLNRIITRVEVDFRIVYVIYIIMLCGTVSSYFLAYNRALFQADQKIYVITLIDSVFQILASITKLISIIVFRSFILYAIAGTISVIGGNIVSYVYYKKQYPWIDKEDKPDKSLLKKLTTNTKDIFIGRIAGYVYGSTDNLVISAFVGTGMVGLVGNYSTITNTIKMLIMGLTSPIQPMLGNYAVSNSCTDTEKTMMNYGFIRFAIALFLVIPTMCLADMFVRLFYGKEYVQPSIIIILLTIDLFLICMEGAVGEMIDALGFFNKEKTMYIVYAIMNLLLSCIGAVIWGVVPIFLATVLSQILGWVWRSVIAYKYYYKSWKKFLLYWIVQIKYVLFFFLCSCLSYVLVKYIPFANNYFGFILYGICIELTVGILFVIAYHKHEEFKYLITLFKRILRRR